MSVDTSDQLAMEKAVIKQMALAKQNAKSEVLKAYELYLQVKKEKPPDAIEFVSFCQERRIKVSYKQCDTYMRTGVELDETVEEEHWEQIIVGPVFKPLSTVEKAFNRYLQAKTYVIKGQKFEPPMDAIEFVSFCQERCIPVKYDECDKFLIAKRGKKGGKGGKKGKGGKDAHTQEDSLFIAD